MSLWELAAVAGGFAQANGAAPGGLTAEDAQAASDLLDDFVATRH